MLKQELLTELKKRKNIIYLATDEAVADDLSKIIGEAIKYIEEN
jgi:hypothetical protein